MYGRTVISLIFGAAVLAGLLAQGCTYRLPRGVDQPPSYVMEEASNTWLARYAERQAADHPGQSGFLLLDGGEESLLARGALAQAAERTLDAQYFIWEDDNVGTIAAERLLGAAERGVRVRVLVDDITIATDPKYLVYLDAHPNIQIRLYNPLGDFNSPRWLRQIKAVLGDFRRLNRRMHNKVFLADSSVGIIGGRNIADEYFDMGTEYNFRDRDVLAAGPVVERISQSFDDYWNSEWSVSVERLAHIEPQPQELEAYYRGLHKYAQDPENFPARFHRQLSAIHSQFDEYASALHWGEATLYYDIPGKNTDPARLNAFGKTGAGLTRLALRTETELLAETPYLVLLPGTFEVVRTLRDRGVDVRLLTNSMAAGDSMPILGAYMHQRPDILELGVGLYELKPRPEYSPWLIKRWGLIEGEQKPKVVLHAKTVVFDRKEVFIGSFNMDPRSTHLNTEIGVLVHNEQLAQEVAELIERDMAPENAWKLSLAGDTELRWTGTQGGDKMTYDADPAIGLAKALKILLFSLVPIRSLI